MVLTRTLPASVLAQARLVCPDCGANDIIKYGKRGDLQVYKCKPCDKKFTDNGALPGRRVPPEQVGTAIDMFYDGLSIKRIAENLRDIFEIPEPSKATIHEWVTDYTRLAKDVMSNHKARTGSEWVADEMVVKVGGKKYWNWNVMDSKTRYILASHLSVHRGTQDAIAVMEKAKANAANLPNTIKTDKLAAYNDGIERVFGADVKHVQSEGIRAEINNNLSERLQGTFRQRVKVLRGLQSKETGQLFLDGWVINYNLFRPHSSLEGKTPAQAAKIDVPFEEWEDFAKLDVRPFSEIRRRAELRRQDSFKAKEKKMNGVKARSPFRSRRL